jgi:hypothetical protein
MAKIYLDEINSALGFSTFDTLEQDVKDSGSANNSIDAYINESSTKLSGEQWDKTRTKMGVYKDALSKRAEVAGILSEAIREALQLLKDYLGTDEMLDSEKLPELKEQRQACAEAIKNLQGMLNEKKTNDAGEEVPAYNNDEVRAQIALAEETLKEIDRLIEKIEGLDEVYNKAVDILDGAYQSVLAFGKTVSGIKPSGKYVYKK